MSSNLYRAEILEHMRTPRNRGTLDKADKHGKARNVSCGDSVELDVIIDDQGVIRDVAFDGAGCAITIAGASIFTEAVKGRRIEEVVRMSDRDMLQLMDLEVTPARESCATVAFKALKKAVQEENGKDITDSKGY